VGCEDKGLHSSEEAGNWLEIEADIAAEMAEEDLES